MHATEIGIIAALFFVFALISRRSQTSILTAPILFTFAGFLAGQTLLTEFSISFTQSSLHTIAEFTLVLVLAADASMISLTRLRENRQMPIRLLGIGLPLTIALGALVGFLVFPDRGWMFAALLASILAPTDAALGQAVVTNEAVPDTVRQSLSVESGLNDGIVLPAVLFFACFFNMAHQTGETNWLVFLSLQLSLGPLVGIGMGWIGGQLIAWAARANWITDDMQGVAAMMLALMSFALAEAVGGNGFLAAFLCGLTYGNLCADYSRFMNEFTETESQLLSYLTFFLFGLAVLPGALESITWEIVLYAGLSLTVVRMVPVALSHIGSGLKMPSILFIGWFGPRGLASLLFALLIVEEVAPEVAAEIQSIVAIAVLLSIIVHGASAAALSRAYGHWADEGAEGVTTEQNM